ncbi:hypothetical protein [Hymenobacter sp. YC55]|uniref:hypothetical protein n=1 Tax=Hymenobacter sp. YC55 TaxID=3034019 RepID=UPI0023F73550|nr:hypothetical protein [Hymenobacter sp. YC55]MDF7812931.1 hypothetical protein [Hymenobacter sp. YC55]
MTESNNEPVGQDWDQLLDQLRQLRQQVKEHGPLPPEEQEEATNAFKQGLSLLENQVEDIRNNSNLKGSSGEW